jgi:hypothetical protein
MEQRKADGVLVVTQRVEDARLVQADNLTQGALGDAVAKLPGTTFKMELNDRMEVTSFEGENPPPRIVAGKQGAGFLMVSLMDEDGWKELAQITFFQPEGPIRKGDQWSRPMSHSWGPLGEWKGRIAFQYGGQRQQLHAMPYVLQLRHHPAAGKDAAFPLPLGDPAFVIRQAGGVIHFDAQQGRVAAAEELFHVTGKFDIALLGQNTTLELEERQEFAIRVHSQNPWAK